MVTVIPPVTLILQLIEMTLSSIGNVNSIFQNMGMTVDPYFFLEQYVPHIDWSKFKQANIKYQTKADIIATIQSGGVPPTADPNSGGGGMM